MLNKMASTLVAAFAGAAAASLVAAMRRQKLAAKTTEREQALQRWEDDGGNIPDHRPAPPAGRAGLRL